MHFFFFTDTAPTEIYTLSLHDALPISHTEPPQSTVVGRYRAKLCAFRGRRGRVRSARAKLDAAHQRDRKSTRLNSSHTVISYAVFCLKKKKTKQNITYTPTNKHNNSLT